MNTLKELLAKKEELEQQIAETRKKELAVAIAKVRALVEEHELTAEDIFGGKKAAGKVKVTDKRSAVPPKFRNPQDATQTWTGRGKSPLWVQALKAAGQLDSAVIAAE